MMLIFIYSEFNWFRVKNSVTSMDSSAEFSMKENTSSLLLLNHDNQEDESLWSRSNSFSSSSSSSTDSDFYTHAQTGQNKSCPFPGQKKLGAHSGHYNRNSTFSGSCISNNISTINEKEVEKTIIISTNTISQVSSDLKDEIEHLRRVTPNLKQNNFTLPHKALLNERLSSSDASDSGSPFRHNLRKNIRRKTCSCDCTSTCTTFVVRRYKEIGQKTVKEETVIASTKLQTCVKNNTSEKIHNVVYKKHFSPNKSDPNKKRRSEVEQVYGSLHEIEWSKNFTSGNILRQLNVRQPTSCSTLGKLTDKAIISPSKTPKKQSPNPDISRTSTLRSYSKNLPENQCTNPFSENQSKKLCSKKQLNNLNSKYQPNKLLPEIHSIMPCSEKSSVNHLHEKVLDSSKFEKVSVQNQCDLQTPIKLHVLKENSHITEHNWGSESNKNLVVFENLQKHLLSQKSASFKKVRSDDTSMKSPLPLATKDENKMALCENIPDIVSDFNLTPSFFNIAEEGIRTIDACFREVGGEVLMSTCYDNDRDLPLLTSINDTHVSPKRATIDDDPPTLEPCISLQESKQELDCKVFSNFVCITDKRRSFTSKENALGPPQLSLSLPKENIEKNEIKIDTQNKNIFKSVARHVKNSSIGRTGKQISKKYLKMVRLKSHNVLVQKLAKKNSGKKPSFSKMPDLVHSTDVDNLVTNGCNELFSESICNSPSELQEKISDTVNLSTSTSRTIFEENENVSLCSLPDIIELHQDTSDSYLYSENIESVSEITYEDYSSLPVTVEKSSSSLHVEHTSVASSSFPTIAKCAVRKAIENAPKVDPIEDVLQQMSFTRHYQTITVNRNTGYTQIILKCTRKNAVFLTVEMLSELQDTFQRASQDNSCQTVILNGLGDSFCMGLDLKPLLGPHKVKVSSEISVAVKNFIETISNFKKPLVAVVNGPACGLGVTILNHADVAIASQSATFCMPQSSLGYFPEGGATLTLPQAVGSTMATDLILRGRTITAREAKNIGLISEILDTKDLPVDLVSRVKTLSENDLSSIETTKAMMKMRLRLELSVVLENEVKLLPQMWLSPSCQQALERAASTIFLAE